MKKGLRRLGIHLDAEALAVRALALMKKGLRQVSDCLLVGHVVVRALALMKKGLRPASVLFMSLAFGLLERLP